MLSAYEQETYSCDDIAQDLAETRELQRNAIHLPTLQLPPLLERLTVSLGLQNPPDKTTLQDMMQREQQLITLQKNKNCPDT